MFIFRWVIKTGGILWSKILAHIWPTEYGFLPKDIFRMHRNIRVCLCIFKNIGSRCCYGLACIVFIPISNHIFTVFDIIRKGIVFKNQVVNTELESIFLIGRTRKFRFAFGKGKKTHPPWKAKYLLKPLY